MFEGTVLTRRVCHWQREGCSSKNVTESLELCPHLGDGVSSTRPESRGVQGRKWLEQCDSRAELRRLHHQGVDREWETQGHFCCYTLHSGMGVQCSKRLSGIGCKVWIRETTKLNVLEDTTCNFVFSTKFSSTTKRRHQKLARDHHHQFLRGHHHVHLRFIGSCLRHEGNFDVHLVLRDETLHTFHCTWDDFPPTPTENILQAKCTRVHLNSHGSWPNQSRGRILFTKLDILDKKMHHFAIILFIPRRSRRQLLFQPPYVLRVDPATNVCDLQLRNQCEWSK